MKYLSNKKTFISAISTAIALTSILAFSSAAYANSLRCISTSGEATHCSYSGNWVSGTMYYWNSTRDFPIVYPTSGWFPYTTNNSAIVFTHSGYASCPSGTTISVSTSLSGYATYTCP